MDDRDTRERKDRDARLFLVGRPTLPPPNGVIAVALFAAGIAHTIARLRRTCTH